MIVGGLTALKKKTGKPLIETGGEERRFRSSENGGEKEPTGKSGDSQFT